MKKSTNIALALSFAASFLFGFASCDEADKTFDCHNICDDYKDCYDSNFDVGKCRTECKNEADKSANFEARADKCAACVSNEASCKSKTFSCGADCAGILIQSTN